MRIREEQMEVFRQSVRAQYEDRLVIHIKDCFPNEFHTMGEKNIREGIQYGVEKALGYGIVAERDVCTYINATMLFGPDFDREFAWAQEAFFDDEFDSADRIDILRESIKLLEES